MPTSTPERSAETVRLTVGMTWQEISAAMKTVATGDFQQFYVRVRSAYAKRVEDERRKAWANQGEAKERIDSSRERT